MKNLKYLLFLTLIMVGTGCKPQQSDESNIGSNSSSADIEELQSGSSQFESKVFSSVAANDLPSFREIAKSVVPQVVHIITSYKPEYNRMRRPQLPDPFRDFFGDDFFKRFENPNSGEPVQSGASGVIVTSTGYIVTNNHVINNADKVEVVLNDRRSYVAKIIGADPSTDLALIKIDEEDLPFMILGNSEEVEVGDWVLAAGNPFNLSSTVTSGIISAKARNINILRDQASIESFLQTDAAVNPGNSGGALVNMKGELIGINSAIATPTGSYTGYSFAIPVNIAKKVINDLLKFGVVQRAYLGVTIRDMDSELASKLGTKRTTGVYVDSVRKGSAAEKAGILPKDIIIAVNDERVEVSPRLQEIIGERRPGDKIQLKLIRKNKEMTVEATLKNVEGTTTIVKEEPIKILEVLGVRLQELTQKDKKDLKLSGGLKVISIGAGKLRDNTSIRPGFIILKVDDKSVTTVDEFTGILSQKKGGVMLEGIYPARPNEVYYYAFGL